MNETEKLAYAALFVLSIALLLTNHLILATIAIVPYVLASFKYSFPQQPNKDPYHVKATFKARLKHELKLLMINRVRLERLISQKIERVILTRLRQWRR